MSDQETMARKGYRYMVFVEKENVEPLFTKTEPQAKEIISTEGGFHMPFRLDSDGSTVWDLGRYVEFSGDMSADMQKLRAAVENPKNEADAALGLFLWGWLQTDQVVEANSVSYAGSDVGDYISACYYFEG